MQVDVISVNGLTFRYNSMTVLRDISLSVSKGDYVGLVGPNGSGKSTLIKTLLGLIMPDEGNVSLFGRSPQDFHEWHKVGYVPQKATSFNPNFPAVVEEIVSLGIISKKGFPKQLNKSDYEAIDRALALMDISGIKDRLFGELSGGQQQRVAIARAVVSEPELLILDEPATALDPETRERFFGILMELNSKANTTIILVTHDIGSIGKYASRLLYLDKEIIFFGSFEDFCVSSEMSRYFGESSQHLICHRH
ncbi:MAG: metal ABC transporter ATP-binding protein [Nitrospirae bacterium]|nr:metal ABC transporter ATP-binding protein [Nitrospirota bacterium]